MLGLSFVPLKYSTDLLHSRSPSGEASVRLTGGSGLVSVGEQRSGIGPVFHTRETEAHLPLPGSVKWIQRGQEALR